MLPPSNFPNGDRNYYNLIELLNYYNDQWSYETKYLMDYGCHCRGDLDRTLAGHGETLRDPIVITLLLWEKFQIGGMHLFIKPSLSPQQERFPRLRKL